MGQISTKLKEETLEEINKYDCATKILRLLDSKHDQKLIINNNKSGKQSVTNKLDGKEKYHVVF